MKKIIIILLSLLLGNVSSALLSMEKYNILLGSVGGALAVVAVPTIIIPDVSAKNLVKYHPELCAAWLLTGAFLGGCYGALYTPKSIKKANVLNNSSRAITAPCAFLSDRLHALTEHRGTVIE
jgi:hypothetical protein